MKIAELRKGVLLGALTFFLRDDFFLLFSLWHWWGHPVLSSSPAELRNPFSSLSVPFCLNGDMQWWCDVTEMAHAKLLLRVIDVYVCIYITNAEIRNWFLPRSCACAALMVGISWAIPTLTDRHVAAFFCIFLSVLSCSSKVLHALRVIFPFSNTYLNILNSITLTINKLCCPGSVLFCSLNPHSIMHTSIRANPTQCFLLRFPPAAKLLYVNFFFIEPS